MSGDWLPRVDFLHEVWFFTTWFGYRPEQIADRLGLTIAYHRRIGRAQLLGLDTVEDRWAA